MSAMSRRKGAGHEREVVNLLKASGHECARNLDQVRDGGGDIPFGEFLIECKRRKSIAIYEWWEQVVAACIRPYVLAGKFDGPLPKFPKPALVIRADKRENLVVLGLNDFLELVSRSPDSIQSRAAAHPRTGQDQRGPGLDAAPIIYKGEGND